jgi:hypothetical protein
MIEKPSENEEEYFGRQEIERKRKLADERQAKVQVEERERAQALHFMKCPKCGMQLEEIPSATFACASTAAACGLTPASWRRP